MDNNEHILDNPVWNAFTTGNQELSHGDDTVRYLSEDVSPFVGLKDLNATNFQKLWNFLENGRVVVVMAQRGVVIPGMWKTLFAVDVEQMVYRGSTHTVDASQRVVSLGREDVPAMLELTKMTDPGPFEQHTIRFGHYEGIYRNGRLAAMAGQRMNPVPYAEISAVCTHPDFTGSGYASLLMKRQINRMLASAGIPFLHVKSSNERAIRLYQHLGFAIRKSRCVYVIQKNND